MEQGSAGLQSAPHVQEPLPFTSHTALGNKDGSDPIRNGDAFDTRVTVTPCQLGRTLRKSARTFSAREMTMNCPECMAILLTKGT